MEILSRDETLGRIADAVAAGGTFRACDIALHPGLPIARGRLILRPNAATP
jgi:hypothetical protein